MVKNSLVLGKGRKNFFLKVLINKLKNLLFQSLYHTDTGVGLE